MSEKQYVWYASYGSNLNRDRFLCYILGGRPEGSEIVEEGCRDKSLPLKEGTLIMNYPLYFAKDSDRWQNQGVGFIGLKKDLRIMTYSRKYLITAEQFLDVVKQENNGAEFEIDLIEVVKKGSNTFKDSWYGTILHIGEEDGWPIFTFTGDWDLDVPLNSPSKHYLKMIIEGLKKSVKLNDTEIINYLSSKPGIEGSYSSDDIKNLI
ncbi:hypothetical protein [Anaerobacillus sp. CMMVII]|uniref:hypothetical protein n=1 Tax=Anaerobacillus sp. CMMVII TaxID=2755588 RepID=UPI0021B83341|nr:hypothetical protein [Anaerobacillus sp. CMMVII]